MKKVFLGLALGIVVCGVAGFLALPGIKQASYDSGFKAGNQTGIVTGTTAGIAQGVAQVEAREKHEHDSVAVAEKNLEALRLKAAHKAHKVAPVVQNWHVLDGKIADPI